MEIKGYLIQNAEGSYLAKALYWYPHDTFADAYVHPQSELERILQASQNWQTKPDRVQRAAHDSERNNTTLVGDGVSIRDLSPDAALSLVRRLEE